MRRALGTLAALALLAGGWLVLTGAGEDDRGPSVRYTIELDNAFGLIEGADVKIAGVRAGRIDGMRLDRRDMRALVDVTIDREGFGDLRTDAFCETRPQSLIGEYFIDCRAGTAPRRLPDGGTVRVQNTGSTVPVDLVNNIMRRPYRERMSIILGELGAGLAARGKDLNETIRRANPALRETDRVLAILREQRHTIRDLYRDADRVVGELAGGKEDVTRFVAEARDTAQVGAARPAQLRRQLRALSRFLAEATETMPLLATAAGRQQRAVADLHENATLLRRFLDTLGPFAEASRPAVRSLGRAAQQGRTALPALEPRLRELAKPASELPEIAKNAAIILEHLDDRGYATERDPRTPEGKGVTGLEALLRYVFFQGQAINLTDGRAYILKIAGFIDAGCAFLKDAVTARDPANQRCAALLGPNRPGINQPDPSKSDAPAARRRAGRAPKAPARTERGPVAPAPQAAPKPAPPAAAAPEASDGLVPQVQQLLDDLLTPKGRGGGLGDLVPDGRSGEPLLDFLLAP